MKFSILNFQFSKKILSLLLILIIAVPAFLSLLNNSYFSMHDDQHIARLFLLDEGIRQGYLYPRWVDQLGFGFGYPLFNFYPPLIYYLGEFFYFLGFSYIWSIKLVVIGGFILGTLGMYLLAKKYLGKVSAYLATTLYTFFTYHAILGYVRGALAEFIAYAILPFVFWSITENSLLFGILFAALILTHPLIAFPSLIFIGLFFIYFFITLKNKWEFATNFIFNFLTGFGLSAFFWIPSLVEKKFTLVDEILTHELASYKLHYVCLQQFWYSAWGYGGSIPGCFDGLSFQLGKIHILSAAVAAILGVVFFIRNKYKFNNCLKNFAFFSGLTLLGLFMATAYSSFIWDSVKFLWYLQFPWRFLTFTGIFISLTGAYVIYFLDKLTNIKFIKIITVITIILATVSVYQKYFKPQKFLNVTDVQLTSYEEIAWRVSNTSHEFIPKGVKTTKTQLDTTRLDIEKEKIPVLPFRILAGQAETAIVKNKFADKEFIIKAKKDTVFELNTYNFPGWIAQLDGKRLSINDDNKYKLITVFVPSGEHKLYFKFKSTPIRVLANGISLVTLVSLIFYKLKKKES